MENKNIILLKHHPIFNLKKDNPYYVNQLGCDSSGYEFFDVTSRCLKDKEFCAKYPSFGYDLSPFYIGPITASDGKVSYIFEHYYQCSKVYPCFVDEKGNVKKEYFEWRNKWFDKKEREENTRHPNKELGYEPGDCLFCLYYENGEYKKIDYITSRKKIYYPAYAKAVWNSKSFKMLKEMVDSGKKICLLDFDCVNYYNHEYKDGLYKDYNCIKDIINSKWIKGGHATVLKAMLQGDIEVVNGEVIDHAGIFD